jgi:enamine deaminase RidA (YjgF/YER057c/UK114 family)
MAATAQRHALVRRRVTPGPNLIVGIAHAIEVRHHLFSHSNRRRPRDLVQATAYLDSMNDFGGANEVYAEFFKRPGPTRTCSSRCRLWRLFRKEAGHE